MFAVRAGIRARGSEREFPWLQIARERAHKKECLGLSSRCTVKRTPTEVSYFEIPRERLFLRASLKAIQSKTITTAPTLGAGRRRRATCCQAGVHRV